MEKESMKTLMPQTSFDILVDYFRDLAKRQQGIDYFFSGEQQEIAQELSSAVEGIALWAHPVTFDEASSICNLALAICFPADGSSGQNEKKMARCEKLTKQIRATLLADYNEGMINASFSKFKYQESKPFKLGGQEFRGIHLTFNFRVMYPVAYDPNPASGDQ